MEKDVMNVLDTLEENVVRELRMLNKKDSLSVTEIKAATDAMCLLFKIKMYREGGMIEDEGGQSYTMWPSNQYDDYSTRPHMTGRYQVNGSYDRGRSPVTGRYVSRDHGYSGHSINDRMISQLENMYDEAKTEYEREEVRKEIDRLRGKSN
jgi:hypothetical protein